MKVNSVSLREEGQGDKLFFWHFDQVKAGAYLPELVGTKVFQAE
jgi:hypothetical protein